MNHLLRYGRAVYHTQDFDPNTPCIPLPLLEFRSVWVGQRRWHPSLTDRHTLWLLRQHSTQQILFTDAYRAWRNSGAHEAEELGEGRAFVRWLARRRLSIAWRSSDIRLHPYFETGPHHHPADEMALGLSFAIAPVCINGRQVKLYVNDDDLLALMQLPYGTPADFLTLVSLYVKERHRFEAFQAPAPPLLEWVRNQGKRPLFLPGQLGFKLPI